MPSDIRRARAPAAATDTLWSAEDEDDDGYEERVKSRSDPWIYAPDDGYDG